MRSLYTILNSLQTSIMRMFSTHDKSFVSSFKLVELKVKNSKPKGTILMSLEPQGPKCPFWILIFRGKEVRVGEGRQVVLVKDLFDFAAHWYSQYFLYQRHERSSMIQQVWEPLYTHPFLRFTMYISVVEVFRFRRQEICLFSFLNVDGHGLLIKKHFLCWALGCPTQCWRPPEC